MPLSLTQLTVAADKLTLPATPNAQIADQARRLQARLDLNHNGYISQDELELATNNASFRGVEAATVVALAQARAQVETLFPEANGQGQGISFLDLTALGNLAPNTATAQATNAIYNLALTRMNAVPRQLFPQGIISAQSSNVVQGMIGDCYLIAAIASLAHKDPLAIRTMIQDNQNGTYTVTVPKQGKIERVTVTAPTDAELGRYASAGPNGLWVSVLEKAYAVSKNNQRILPYLNPYQAADGGDLADAGIIGLRSPVIPARWDDVTESSVPFSEMFHDLLRHRAILVAGTPPARFDGELTPQGLVKGHAYSVIAADPVRHTLTVRNPWGAGGPNNDGIHVLTEQEFRTNFRSAASDSVATANWGKEVDQRWQEQQRELSPWQDYYRQLNNWRSLNGYQ